MKQNPSGAIETMHHTPTPARRATLSGAVSMAMGLSSAFLVVISGFAVAMTVIWPG